MDRLAPTTRPAFAKAMQVKNTVQYFPINIMLKMVNSSFNKEPFDPKGGHWPPLKGIEHWISAFIIRLLDSIISKLATSKFQFSS